MNNIGNYAEVHLQVCRFEFIDISGCGFCYSRIMLIKLLSIPSTFQRTNELLLKYFSRHMGSWSVLSNMIFLGYLQEIGEFRTLFRALVTLHR